MKKNAGTFDRIVRATMALSVLFLYYNRIVADGAAIIILVVSAIMVLTSLTGVCPLYSVLSISTCPSRKTDQGFQHLQ
jgi:hypothetical protein